MKEQIKLLSKKFQCKKLSRRGFLQLIVGSGIIIMVEEWKPLLAFMSPKDQIATQSAQLFLQKFQLTADQKALLLQKLDQKWANMFEPELRKGSALIEVVAFALDAISVDYQPNRFETALDYLNKNLNRSDKNPKTYGNIFWYNGDTVINDPNCVEFCLRQLILIWILYQDKLSPRAKKTIQEILNLGTEGMKRHGVKLSYTNIILMKISNLILLGEYYDNPVLAQMGYGLLKEWIVHTYQYGLCEYLSPAYYAVDIENLSLIYNFTNNPEIKKIAATALEYIWTDIALNWYAPSQRLGGTHSRDYDRLYGHGALDKMVNRAGWNNKSEEKQSLTTVFHYYAFVSPAPGVKKYLTDPFPRFIYEKWGAKPFQRSSNYTGVNFSVASAEANYYNMDKAPLVINIGSGYDVPIINFFMDGREDYYGFKKTSEKSGHLKSLHLKPFITSVQNDSEVLFLASIKDDTDDSAEKLESIITLPSDSEIWLDNQKLAVFNSKSSWQTIPEANHSTTWLKVTSINQKPVVRIIDQAQNAGIGIQQKFNVIPRNEYSLKAFMKGQIISLSIKFYDQNDNLIHHEHKENIQLNKNEFTWNKITEKAPEHAVYCKAWIYSSTKNVTDVYISDIVFEEINPGRSTKILGSFDFKEEISQGFSIPENANLFIKREDVVAVIRLIKALDVSGHSIDFTLYNDGLKYGAFRLTATHSKAKTGKKGSIVVWAYAEERITDDRKFSDYRNKVLAVKSSLNIDQGKFDVKVSGITGEMKLIANVLNEERILQRGMKSGLKESLLAVNGNDIGKTILESLDIIKSR